MALLAEAGTLTIPGATGNQTTSLSNGIWGGSSPKLLLLLAAENSSDGIATTVAVNFGAAVSSSSRATIGKYSANGAGTSNVRRNHDNTKCIATHTSSVLSAADFVSFGADEFTLDWTTVNSGKLVGYLALGGSDLANVGIKEFTAPASTGNQDYTGLGFDPNALLIFGVASTSSPPNIGTGGNMFFGVCEATNDFHTQSQARNGLGTSDTFRNQDTDAAISNMSSGGSENLKATCTFISDGFRLNWSATVSGVYYWAVAIDATNVVVVNDTQNTTAAAKTTDLGFAAQAGMLFSYVGTANTAKQDDDRQVVGFLDDSGNQVSIGNFDEDNQSTTDADRSFDSNEVLRFYDHAQSLDAAATGSFSGNDISLDWTTADATARQWGGLFLGGTAASTANNLTLLGVG